MVSSNYGNHNGTSNHLWTWPTLNLALFNLSVHFPYLLLPKLLFIFYIPLIPCLQVIIKKKKIMVVDCGGSGYLILVGVVVPYPKKVKSRQAVRAREICNLLSGKLSWADGLL